MVWSDNREQILTLLADGEFVSGEAIGEKLGISRAAVSKHIKALAELGLDIFSVSGKGYKLAHPVSLMNKARIAEYCDQVNQADIHVLIETDSTNSYLLRQLHQGLESGETVVAEQQTAGRGRRGRQWVSPFASHVYFSMYWSIPQGLQAAMGLSLAAGLAITDCLAHLGITGGQLKWPNDVYHNGKKMAGVLVELEGQLDGPCHAIIGIGINIDMPQLQAEEIDQPWTDLNTASDSLNDRNQVVGLLRGSLLSRLQEYSQTGLSGMIDDWNSLNLFADKNVRLISANKELTGRCMGIDAVGGLILENEEGERQTYYGGELSLRAGDETVTY